MKRIKIFFLIIFLSVIYSCAEYKSTQTINKKEKIYYSSSGFALIYSNEYYEQKIISKKFSNNTTGIMHSTLKKNTPVKIINPDAATEFETKVDKIADYPMIFNVVISKEIASLLELDPDNPYVEINELKKNKKFVAKKSNTFDEEKNVAEKAPVEEIKMDDITKDKNKTEEKKNKKQNFIIIINDFYYYDSANNLRDDLIKKTNMTNISIKKINNNKYRLFAGPFKNFNALKSNYISLNNLGFESLDVYRE